MPLPGQFHFEKANKQTLVWEICDGMTAAAVSPTMISDATVTATLYFDRGRGLTPQGGVDPAVKPGTPVANFQSLQGVAQGNGVYWIEIAEAFDPDSGENYVLVVDAHNDAGYQGHWERPAVVEVRSER